MKGSVEPWFKHRFSWCCFLLVRHQSFLLLFVMCKKQINLKPCALFFSRMLVCWVSLSAHILDWFLKYKKQVFLNCNLFSYIYFFFTPQNALYLSFIWCWCGPVDPTLDFPLCKVALYQLSWADPASVGLVLSVKAMVGLVCHRGSVVYLSVAPHL